MNKKVPKIKKTWNWYHNLLTVSPIYLLLSVLIFIAVTKYVNEIRITINPTNPERLSKLYLEKILHSNQKLQKIWTFYDVILTAQIIDRMSKKYNLDYITLYAMISHESGFNPYAIGKNKNQSLDIGISQQNSDFVNRRCRKILYRKCSRKDLYNIVISLNLMEVTMDECFESYKGFEQVQCYNYREGTEYTRLIKRERKRLVDKYGKI